MKQRAFGTTGKNVSEIGLGTWQIGGSWGNVSDAEALQILHKATDTGVTFFDTADVYGDGRSEKLIGRFLKESSNEVFVATKIGRWNTPGWPKNFTFEAMRQHVEACLSRLNVDTLELVQLHCIPTDELKKGEVFNNLRRLQQEGKIKQFGVSVETMEEGLICLEQNDVASLQIIFNIFRQKPISTLFDAAKSRNVALIVRVPLASGLLSGKMTKQTKFDETDHRNFNRDGSAFNVGETFAGLPFEIGIDLVDKLKAMVPDGMTMPQMALRWILDFDSVTTVIPGASNASQVESNISASQLAPLPVQLHKALSEFYEQSVASHIRGPY
jgi:aryl-alcohol dehydrogenase-like predicted oxidoreductase